MREIVVSRAFYKSNVTNEKFIPKLVTGSSRFKNHKYIQFTFCVCTQTKKNNNQFLIKILIL